MWRFMDLKPGEPERNPHEAEFFRLTNATEAIVREFIQNSLDAKRDDVETVRVRFVLGDTSKRSLGRLLGSEFERHLKKCNLFPAEYDGLTRIPFLTIEDFGTTGLDGDTGETRRPEGRHNFYNFWWCEGKSSKSGKDAGRWGLGKTTFHMASRFRAFWGLTVRHDDHRKLLMGKVLMNSHSLDGKTYQYFAYYVDDGHKPIEGDDSIQEFVSTFSISRVNEPGLSIIIPMPAEDIETGGVVRSAIYHYFYAIMTGLLEVEIVDSSGTTRLSSSNLVDMAKEQDWGGTEWEDTNVGVFLNFVKLCIQNPEHFQLPRRCAEQLLIDEDSFGDELDRLRHKFLDNELISIRVPVVVKRNRGVRDSYFDVYIQRDATLKRTQEYYVRSGITVVDVKSLKNRPVRALFLADEPVITEFLGDAETPAHTQWNDKTEGFRDKYHEARQLLSFIRRSMETIVTVLDLPPEERQMDLLRDIFYIIQPVDRDEEEVAEGEEIEAKERKPALFKISRLEDGLRVSLANSEKKPPFTGVLAVAYDVRRGNPFKQYEPSDFDVSGETIQIEHSRCKITSKSRNIVEFDVMEPDFWLELRGFDRKRDLVVDVKEKAHEAQA